MFAKFVGGQFTLAHRRHEALMAGGSRQPIAGVPCEYKEYEARLVVVGLLRVLPQDIQKWAVEDTNTSITSNGLIEELVNLVQPVGKEEVAALLHYVCGLDPPSSAEEALETLRRWRNARARAAALNLPPGAPKRNP